MINKFKKIRNKKMIALIATILIVTVFAFVTIFTPNYKKTNSTVATNEPVKNGWIEENGYKYLYENGIKLTGFQDVEGGTYYFNEDGRMVTGTQVIDEQTYTFDESGKLLVDNTPITDDKPQDQNEQADTNEEAKNTETEKEEETSTLPIDKVENTTDNKNTTYNKPNDTTSNQPEKPKPETPKPEVPKGINSMTVANLKAAQNSDNILIVSASSVNSKDITAYYYEKNGGSWKESFKVAGTVGRNGINKVGEGDKRTPTGIFGVTKLFGLNANPGTRLPYHQLTGSEYWCGGKFYNQWVDENTMDHSGCNKKDDEHLASYPIVYDYVAALNFNSANVAGKGSAIFIHCLRNTGSPTAGCIALPKTQMKYFMQRLNTSTKVIIDLESNILNY